MLASKMFHVSEAGPGYESSRRSGDSVEEVRGESHHMCDCGVDKGHSSGGRVHSLVGDPIIVQELRALPLIYRRLPMLWVPRALPRARGWRVCLP